jgi:hypothetical protein
MIAAICSFVNRDHRIAPSESGAGLSTCRWSENPGAAQRNGEPTTLTSFPAFAFLGENRWRAASAIKNHLHNSWD